MPDSKSPWGRKPTGGGTTPGDGKGPNPSLEALLAAYQEWLRTLFGGEGGQSEKRWITRALVVMVVLWLTSGFYRVNSDELGVVLRFGEYQRTAGPGLNYHLPAPIEQVLIPSVTTVNTVQIGSRTSGAENPNVRIAKAPMALADATKSAPPAQEGLMLTGDRNLVDIDFTVQWKIDASAPEKFLFNMRNPAENVRYVAESAMREVIGRTTLDDVLTGAQSQIAEDTKTLMQQVLNEYDAGIEIISVNLSRPDVPAPVIDEFQDVKRAEQDKQTAESVAEGYRNEILPKAKGDAAKMLQDAEAYKAQVVADAAGDAARFKQIYAEYAQAKEVTKRRMYLETMESVLKGMPKVITEKGGVTPILPLNLPAARASVSESVASPAPAKPPTP